MLSIKRASTGLLTQRRCAPCIRILPSRSRLHVAAQQQNNPGPLSNVMQHVTALTQVCAVSMRAPECFELRCVGLHASMRLRFGGNHSCNSLAGQASSLPPLRAPFPPLVSEIRFHEYWNGCHGCHQLLRGQGTRPVHCPLHHLLFYDRSTGKHPNMAFYPSIFGPGVMGWSRTCSELPTGEDVFGFQTTLCAKTNLQ